MAPLLHIEHSMALNKDHVAYDHPRSIRPIIPDYITRQKAYYFTFYLRHLRNEIISTLRDKREKFSFDSALEKCFVTIRVTLRVNIVCSSDRRVVDPTWNFQFYCYESGLLSGDCRFIDCLCLSPLSRVVRSL